MTQSEDNATHIQWLIALGNQPGVSAWFAVWCWLKRRRIAESPVAPATEGDARLCPNTQS